MSSTSPLPCLMPILMPVLSGFSVAAMVLTAAMPATAQSLTLPTESPALPAESPGTPVPAPAPAADPDSLNAEIANYSDEAISIDYPATWQIEVEDDSLKITNLPDTEAGLVATQIFQIDAPPGPLVNANIDSFLEEGSTVGRYRTITVDGQSALVMWLSDRPDTLSQAIATFIGYGDKTVFLFSRYADTNSTAESEILRLHTSFSNLAAQSSAAEGSPVGN